MHCAAWPWHRRYASCGSVLWYASCGVVVRIMCECVVGVVYGVRVGERVGRKCVCNCVCVCVSRLVRCVALAQGVCLINKYASMSAVAVPTCAARCCLIWCEHLCPSFPFSQNLHSLSPIVLHLLVPSSLSIPHMLLPSVSLNPLHLVPFTLMLLYAPQTQIELGPLSNCCTLYFSASFSCFNTSFFIIPETD